MKISTHSTPKGHVIAQVEEAPQINQVYEATDLMASLNHVHRADAALVTRAQFAPAFYELRTGLAGEILQKFTNYHFLLGIVGDFSGESSRALRDFIYECNQGRQVCFLPNEEEALSWLTARLDG